MLIPEGVVKPGKTHRPPGTRFPLRQFQLVSLRKETLMALRKISGKELPAVTAVTDRFSLVDFSATWCGPCKMLHPVLEQVSGEMPDWDFYEIDIDQNQSEAAQYGIRGVPTLIVFKGGKEIDRLVGFRDKPSLLTQLQAIAFSAP